MDCSKANNSSVNYFTNVNNSSVNYFTQYCLQNINIKPLYIAYKRAREDLLYKLELSFLTKDIDSVSWLDRLEVLSWYIKEKYHFNIKFDCEFNCNDNSILRCYINSYKNNKEKVDDIINFIERVFSYWFKADLKNYFSFLHDFCQDKDTLIHINIKPSSL